MKFMVMGVRKVMNSEGREVSITYFMILMKV